MYSTCLFCNGELGSNEAIESFPVGRRLAFDAAKGRLWVVCRKCERWNLTPLEERWEAIEACERAFGETKLRATTGEIGLARLKEGLELVRIGAPMRPEMAAWRYGDQFGRRRRRMLLAGGGVALVTAGWIVAGPVLGLVGGASMSLVNILNGGRAIYRATVKARIGLGDGTSLVVSREQMDQARLLWDHEAERWGIDLTHQRAGPDVPWWHMDIAKHRTTLTGDDAVRAARHLLPVVNANGAWGGTVRDAVTYLEESPDPSALANRAALTHAKARKGELHPSILLTKLPASVRLAMEMSAHEETERRALDGELHLLESAWKDAEEIAQIADDMFLPEGTEAELERLRRLPPRDD